MAAKFSYSAVSWTPLAVADTAAYTDARYMAIQGAASPFTALVSEVMEEGESSSSVVNIMVLARDSTVGVTLSNAAGAMVAALHPSTAAARATGFNTSTTKPQRSSTLHLLTLSFNAFGGIVRWVAFPGEEMVIIGATQPFGEMSLSGYTLSAAGAMSSHIVFEEQ